MPDRTPNPFAAWAAIMVHNPVAEIWRRFLAELGR